MSERNNGMSSAETNLQSLSEAEYKKRIRAWTLYDWANSAFATTILAAVLPVYYSSVAGSTLPSAATATQYWSITLSISVFIIAIISPVLGTVSDIMRGKKKFLSFFIGIGVIGTGLMMLVNTGDWLIASIFFIVGRVGFGASIVFYDALLAHVAKEEDQDAVSMRGYAFGYLGGGILLAINIVMIFALPDNNLGVRLSFLSVAIWWAVFSIPLLTQVPEPEGGASKLANGQSLISSSFKQIWTTLRNIRDYKDLFRFLIAFLIYNDGIGIIISVAAIYGAELGFNSTELILAILLVQFVGIPYSLVFGNMPSKANKRQTMAVAFILFNLVSLPIVAIAGKNLLPKAMTGTPSPAFETIGSAVGEGSYQADAASVALDGSWSVETFSAELTGLEEAATFASGTAPNDRYNFEFNGQKVLISYRSGPDHGIWAVEVDGQPLLDADGEQITVDAYNATPRFDDTIELTAESEGVHVLTLVNTGETSAESTGTVMAINRADVLPPLRSSNLGAILGLLVAVVLVGAAFAALTGNRLFSGIAERLDTKGSIMIALVAYSIIAVWGFFLDSVIEFWFLAWMVATSQGGSQGLSRSLYAAMSPSSKSGEFFGFFSIMSRFASFFSPFVFVASVALFDSSRPGVLALIVFFLIGMYLLRGVDVEAGKQLAREVDAA